MATRIQPVTSIYRRDEVIGRGNFGVVYKGVKKDTKQVVAIKILNLDTIEDDLLDIQQEISTLSQLSQSDAVNIPKYYGSYLAGTKLWIIMDLCAGGNVRTLLKAGKFEERHISVIVREVCVALSYIHKEGIIHRDIKAANILITNTGAVRLCDFGVAARVTANKLKRSTIVGTPYWMAPEVITEGATYNSKADIWSLGVTVYEIATGKPPYSDQEVMRAIMLIPRQKPARLEGSQYSAALKEFVACCLDENPEERPSAEELLKVKFVKSSRSNPTSILKEVVQRFMTWKQTNHVRDSVALAKGIDHNDDDSSGGEEEEEDGQEGREGHENSGQNKNYRNPRRNLDRDGNEIDSDLWDFDTSDVTTTFDYDPMVAKQPDTNATNDVSRDDKLNGLGFSYPASGTTTKGFGAASQENTIRAPPPPALEPGAPQSLMELFGDEYSPGKATAPIMSPAGGVPQESESQSQSALPTQPSTPTVEIEIPTFDSLETESMVAASATNTARPQQLQTQNNPLPPSIPPQSAQRSRSNTLNAISSSQTNMGPLPPVPTIPAAGGSESPQQQSGSQPGPPSSGSSQPVSNQSASSQSGAQSAQQPSGQQQSAASNLVGTGVTPANTMLPPQMPHSQTTTRRTPSPKRMTAKGSSVSGNTSSTNLTLHHSPPKPATTMKPLVRSRLHNDVSALVDDGTYSNYNTDDETLTSMTNTNNEDGSSNNNYDYDTEDDSVTINTAATTTSTHKSNQSEDHGPKKLTVRKQPPRGMHISMPPPPLPFQTSSASASSSTTTSTMHSESFHSPQLLHTAAQNYHAQRHASGNDNEDELSFPQIPKLDTSILLDSTQKQDTIGHLDAMLEGFGVGLASLEEGLYNLVM